MALVQGIASVSHPGSCGHESDFDPAVPSHTGGTVSTSVRNSGASAKEDFTLSLAALAPGP